MERKQFNQLMDRLSKITWLLGVLATPIQTQARASLLSTSLRKKMFSLMNGKRPSKEIANMAGTSRQNVDKFVKELNKAGLVILIRFGKGKTKCPRQIRM